MIQRDPSDTSSCFCAHSPNARAGCCHVKMKEPQNHPAGREADSLLLTRIRCNAHHGFTLIELMVALTVAAILTFIAVPSYQGITNSHRIGAEANDLLGDIEFARSEAIKRGQTVVVCASTNSNTCSGSSTWNSGWIVLLPASNSCTATGGASGDTVLRVRQSFASKDTATYQTGAAGGSQSMCFTRLGIALAQYAGEVTFNTAPASSSSRRCLALSPTGHAQVLTVGQTDPLGVGCP